MVRITSEEAGEYIRDAKEANDGAKLVEKFLTKWAGRGLCVRVDPFGQRQALASIPPIYLHRFSIRTDLEVVGKEATDVDETRDA